MPAGVLRSSPPSTSASARSSAASPSVSRSRSSSGASKAAESTWPSRIRGLAWSRIAASTRRSSSASGSRMKNWSSASSLATSTARPSLRRPARPHCWRRLATVPGKPDRDGAVEQADVDAELERVGGRHAEELALDQAPLDLAPLRGRVAGPVGREPRGGLRVEALGGEAVDQLDRLAALGEADRPQAARDELGEEPRALPERAGAELERLVEHRRVPEGDRARRPRAPRRRRSR